MMTIYGCAMPVQQPPLNQAWGLAHWITGRGWPVGPFAMARGLPKTWAVVQPINRRAWDTDCEMRAVGAPEEPVAMRTYFPELEAWAVAAFPALAEDIRAAVAQWGKEQMAGLERDALRLHGYDTASLGAADMLTRSDVQATLMGLDRFENVALAIRGA